MSQLLFVYGTLRPGFDHPMARVLAQRGRLLGRARAAARLYNLGRYPGILEPQGEDDWVHGEVYELRDDGTLEEMDRYENAESPLPAFFERRLEPVIMEGGEKRDAWLYWFRGAVDEERRISGGDWLAAGRNGTV